MGKEKVTSAACGSDFTMVVTEKGQLYAFGSPEYGQVIWLRIIPIFFSLLFGYEKHLFICC